MSGWSSSCPPGCSVSLTPSSIDLGSPGHPAWASVPGHPLLLARPPFQDGGGVQLPAAPQAWHTRPGSLPRAASFLAPNQRDSGSAGPSGGAPHTHVTPRAAAQQEAPSPCSSLCALLPAPPPAAVRRGRSAITQCHYSVTPHRQLQADSQPRYPWGPLVSAERPLCLRASGGPCRQRKLIRGGVPPPAFLKGPLLWKRKAHGGESGERVPEVPGTPRPSSWSISGQPPRTRCFGLCKMTALGVRSRSLHQVLDGTQGPSTPSVSQVTDGCPW